MASKVNLSDLTPDHKLAIRTALSFVPKPTRFELRRAKGGFSAPGASSRPPIRLYNVDRETGVVRLPFQFAAGLLGRQSGDGVYPSHPFTFTRTLRDNQVEPVAKAKHQLSIARTTVIGLDPAAGKTVIGAYLAVDDGSLTCVICPRRGLLKQWEKTFNEFTTARIWMVGRKPPKGGFDVIIVTPGMVGKIDPAIRDAVGFLLVDEAHMMCTEKMGLSMLMFTPRKIVLETATFQKENGLHTMLQAIVGTHGVFPDKPTKPFDFIKVSTGYRPVMELTPAGVPDFSKLMNTIGTSVYRNNLIADIVSSYADKKIMILSDRNIQVYRIYNILKARGESVDFLCGTRDSYEESRVLVAGIKKSGTGFDEASFSRNFNGRRIDMVILVTSFRDTNLLYQTIGRAFRSDYPMVVHLVDENTIIKNHWRECRKWYLSRLGTESSRSYTEFTKLDPNVVYKDLFVELGVQMAETYGIEAIDDSENTVETRTESGEGDDRTETDIGDVLDDEISNEEDFEGDDSANEG